MTDAKPFIVIVDDDESVRRAIKRLVRSLGMEADTFATGNEFLQLLTAMPSYCPDCLVLDVQMPGMNGLEVQQKLAPRILPIIFITAHDDMAVREQALNAGALAFLRKPFNDEIFIKTVQASLLRGQHNPAARNQ